MILQKLAAVQDVLSPSAPGDYSTLSSTLTFTSSATMRNVSIAIANDTIGERNEQFTVTLSSSDQSVIASANPAVVTISNDDGTLPLYSNSPQPTACILEQIIQSS